MRKKIVLIGLGHIGKIHLKLLTEDENWEVAGVYDIKPDLTAQLAAEYGVPVCSSLQDALDRCDAVDIATPSSTHFEIACAAVKSARHVFVEKPVTSTLSDARALRTLVGEAAVVCQVGHVER